LPVIDLFNQEIISYEIARPVFNQVVAMLKKAFSQGWQYQMKQYQQLMKKKRIVQSM